MVHNHGNGVRDLDHIHTPSWRIFRIMSEFVDGFTFLADIQEDKSVSIFGSARMGEDHPFYQMAYEIAKKLAEKGYTIVTGGGPGIMEAANRGAFDVNGQSVGLNIELPHEQEINPYVKEYMTFKYFFSRKVMLDYAADAYIFLPGGFGTLDEFFELITLVQTNKIEHDIPVILLGQSYWGPLIHWIETELVQHVKTINPEDLQLWTLTDDIDQAVSVIESSMQRAAEKDERHNGYRSILSGDDGKRTQRKRK